MTYEEYYGDAYPILKQIEQHLLTIIQTMPVPESMEGIEPIIYCTSRIKTPESMMEKLTRMGFATDCDTALREMHDAVGIRVVCSFIDNVYQIADMLCSHPDFEVIERKDYIAHPKPNGYRSLHLILRIKDTSDDSLHPIASSSRDLHPNAVSGKEPHPNTAPSWALDPNTASDKNPYPNTALGNGLLGEIQLRTIATDFWAALEHQIKYKQNIPHEKMIRSELKRCADEIASVDMSMQTIRDVIRNY